MHLIYLPVATLIQTIETHIQYIFDSFENFAAEPTWWDGLPTDAKDDLKMKLLNWTDLSLATDSGTLIPGMIRFADWEVEEKRWF